MRKKLKSKIAFWTQIIISSSGGGSITISAPTSGSIDDSNKAFGFAVKPKVVVVNGASYQENHGWSWNNGTLIATLDNPAGASGDIYSIS